VAPSTFPPLSEVLKPRLKVGCEYRYLPTSFSKREHVSVALVKKECGSERPFEAADKNPGQSS